jgi:small subunit ribosomal protein S1
MSAEKRINHPQEVVKIGQLVRAQILAVDAEKRQLRLSMKQLVPSGLDEYMAEHKEGDVVTGRMIDVSPGTSRVELGEGIEARCRMEPVNTAVARKPPKASGLSSSQTNSKVPSKPDLSSSDLSSPDLSSLSSMLQARWKGNTTAGNAKPETIRIGEIRKFRISKLDAAAKKIELELA